MIQMNLLIKQKHTHKLREQTYSCWGQDSYRVWYGHVHTAMFKMDNQQGLTYSTWNSVQCYMAAWMEAEFRGEWIHVYV